MVQPIIEFKDIRKRFGDQEVLKGINLALYKGETLAVIGKSGTGKSVLLKHMIGLIRPDAGTLLIEGTPMDKMSRGEIKAFQKNLSYMFQDNALFDFLNIFENIALPLNESALFDKTQIQDRVQQKMRQLGLEGVDKKFPAQLSGGMRKRVALARALVTDPSLVLFDEPTTGLDPVRKKNVYEMIQEYQSQFGFTAVIVSHDIPQVFYICQRIAMLDDGIIRFEGKRDNILQSHNKILNAFITGQDEVSSSI